MYGPLVKAMVVIRRPSDGALLVQTEPDRVPRFERPLGGHVELGERAEQAARRELLEEIGEPIENVRSLGVVENLFTLDGEPGHEVVFVFEADFVDAGAYDVEERAIADDPTGTILVKWRAPDDDSTRFVPEEIAALVMRATGAGRPPPTPTRHGREGM